jgi:hypothetical protein
MSRREALFRICIASLASQAGLATEDATTIATDLAAMLRAGPAV